MRKHTLNLYRITNLHEFDFSYKLVTFDLPRLDGQEELYNKQLHKIAQSVSSLISGPTAIVRRNNKTLIAIPSDRSLSENKIDVVAFTITVRMLPDIHKVDSRNVNEDNRDIISKFLDFEIRRQLSFDDKLWKLNSNQFFLKKPFFSNDQSQVEVYGGFNYKLILLSDKSFYVCLDLASKYIDKHYLSNYIDSESSNDVTSRYKGKRVLYQNGDDWYTTEIVGFGKTIKEHEFSRDGLTYNVYDYLITKTANHKFNVSTLVQPDDRTLLYKYPGRSMESHNGASSLARILYHTGDSEVKALHKMSIKDPTKRFELINKNIKTYFHRLTFNKKIINIASHPVVENVRNFQIPGLKFNNGRQMTVGHFKSGGNTAVKEFGLERKQHIIDNGILTKSNFDEQFLVVPDTLDKELVEGFKRNAEWFIKKLAPAFLNFKVIRYKVKEGQAATIQIQEIEKTLSKNNALNGFALFLLPDLTYDSKKNMRRFHDCLKSKFYPDLKVQCASSSKIRSFFQAYANADAAGLREYKVPVDKQSRFRSYLFNLVMEHLIVNRKWPYALSQPLHYDIYVGVDVHSRYAGFTFFFRNGENIFFFPIQVPLKSKGQRAEKLKSSLLYKMIYEKLKILIPQYAPNPNGIVIIRDGRSFGEEERALKNVIETLTTDGLFEKSQPFFGVVDLHKQSAIPLRIATQTDGYVPLENPIAGTYKLLNDREGFIFNTGFPFQNPGSAKPLHLSLKAGNIDFIKALEDIFSQSMLAFSAPDRSSSLPVTIKLIDTLLEPLAATSESLEEQEEEYEEIIQN